MMTGVTVVAGKVGTFPWCEVVDEAAEGVPQRVDDSDGRARNRAFSLAKANSIGFKSGL
jgi:hypothetical protein